MRPNVQPRKRASLVQPLGFVSDAMISMSDTSSGSPAKLEMQIVDDDDDDGGTERWLEHLSGGGDAEGGTLNHFSRFQVGGCASG